MGVLPQRYYSKESVTAGLKLGVLVAVLLLVGGCLSEETSKRSAGHGFDDLGLDCGALATAPADLADVDLSMTPRADRVAEILALQATGAFVAPEARYQRIVAELAGMAGHGMLPDGGAAVRGCAYPDRLVLKLTDSAIWRVRAGTYRAWHDLNELLRVEQIDLTRAGNYVWLYFDGLYNPPRLGREYASLSGVISTSPGASVGDGNDTCLAIRDSIHFYILREGSGDCPSGCIERSYTGVEVDSSGNIQEVGTWDGSGDAPAWFEDAEDCRSFFQEY